MNKKTPNPSELPKLDGGDRSFTGKCIRFIQKLKGKDKKKDKASKVVEPPPPVEQPKSPEPLLTRPRGQRLVTPQLVKQEQPEGQQPLQDQPQPQDQKSPQEGELLLALKLKRKKLQELKQKLELASLPVPGLIVQGLTDRQPKDVQGDLDACNTALQSEDDLTAYLATRNRGQLLRVQCLASAYGSHGAVLERIQKFDEERDGCDDKLAPADTPAKVGDRTRALEGLVNDFATTSTQLLETLASTDKLILAAQNGVGMYLGFGGNTELQALAQRVQTARQKFTDAKTEQAVADTLPGIEGWEVTLKNALGGKGESVKHLKKYTEKRKALQDQIGKAGLLRGATEPGTPVYQLLEAARVSVKEADRKMSEYQGESDYTDALEELAKHEDLLKNAKIEDGKLKEQSKLDLEALPKYNDAFQALLQAISEIAGLPGVKDQQAQAKRLLQATQIKGQGLPPEGGYAAALKRLLAETAPLLEMAKRVSAQYLNDRLKNVPRLDDAHELAQGLLKTYGDLHPTSMLQAQQEALAEALLAQDPVKAVTEQINALRQDIKAQQLNRSNYELERQKADQLLKQLDGLIMPSDVLNELRNTGPIDRMATAKEYGEALNFAKRIQEAALQQQGTAKALNKTWLGLAEQLMAGVKNVPTWQGWPPLAQAAMALDVRWKLLMSKVERDGDLTYANEQAEALLEELAKLQDQVKNLRLDPQEGLEPLNEAVKEASKTFFTAAQNAENALKTLAEALQKAGAGSSSASTALHQELADLRAGWSDKLTQISLKPGQSIAEVLQQLLLEMLPQLLKVQNDALAAVGDPNKLKPHLETAKKSESQVQRRALYDEVRRMLQLMESWGLDTQRMWITLGRQYTEGEFVYRQSEWLKLKVQAANALKARKEELDRELTRGLDLADQVDSKLSSFFDGDQRRYKGLYETLRERAADAREMLNSQDSTLIAAGLKELQQLEKLVLEGKKGGTDDDKQPMKTFDDLGSSIKELSAKVGQKELREGLPATYFRLYAQWKKVVKKAQSLPPHEGWKEVEAMRLPIEDALEQLQRRNERYSLFKSRSEQLTQKLEELHKLTKTSVTEKTKAYDKQFTASMERAKETAKQEGQMDAAFAMLNELDKELSSLLGDPQNARDRLMQLDSQAAGKQRMLRDMAREWQATQTYWTETLLPRVKQALKDRGERDSGEYEGLKGGLKSAGAPLKLYLEALATIPSDQSVAPDMDAASEAFSRAYGRLAGLQRTADRLISGGGTTNVQLQKDLEKLDQEWVQRVSAAQKALQQLSQKVGALPEQVKDVEQDPNYLPPGDGGGSVRGKFRQAVDQVARVLADMSTRFGPSAFTGSLKVLGNEQAAEVDRLKAREDVLRTLRHLRAEIVDSQLLRQVFEGTEQGMFPDDIRPQLGLMRASLRKIELAALVAI